VTVVRIARVRRERLCTRATPRQSSLLLATGIGSPERRRPVHVTVRSVCGTEDATTTTSGGVDRCVGDGTRRTGRACTAHVWRETTVELVPRGCRRRGGI